MATTLQHDETDTTARPTWPQHARTDDGIVDLRDDAQNREVTPVRDEREVPVRRRGLRARRTLGWILAAAALAVVAIVATVNRTGDIGIDLAVADGTLPLWSIIAGAAAMGFAAGRFLDDGC
jgi:hypothetical protein